MGATSYASVARTPASERTIPASRPLIDTLFRCCPSRSIIVGKIENPLQYGNTIHLQNYIKRICPAMLEVISKGKLLPSGNIMLEANSEPSLDILLKNWPDDAFGGKAFYKRAFFTGMSQSDRVMFGPGAPTNPVVNPRVVVLKRVPCDYQLQDVKDSVTREYHSASDFVEISSPGSKRHIRFSLVDEDYNKIVVYGVHIGLCLHRVEDWVAKPLQCFHCQRFGHHSSMCKSESRCINCGGSHERIRGVKCDLATKCCNCGENHLTNSTKCAVYKKRFASHCAPHHDD